MIIYPVFLLRFLLRFLSNLVILSLKIRWSGVLDFQSVIHVLEFYYKLEPINRSWYINQPCLFDCVFTWASSFGSSCFSENEPLAKDLFFNYIFSFIAKLKWCSKSKLIALILNAIRWTREAIQVNNYAPFTLSGLWCFRPSFRYFSMS